MSTQPFIAVYPYDALGAADYGWLKARYHFSFANYHHPERTGFGALLVINDDVVKAGAGFDMHPHRDMEIITYVRQGAISHRDNAGHEGRTAAGDVQVMSAGTGVYHSEYNHESEDTSLYQIWIAPNQRGVAPRWDARRFPKQEVSDQLPLLVSGRVEDEAKGALFIHQDAAIYGGRITAGAIVHQPIKYQAYLLVSEGEIEVMGQRITAGDGAEIMHQPLLALRAISPAEVVMIDVPQLTR